MQKVESKIDNRVERFMVIYQLTIINVKTMISDTRSWNSDESDGSGNEINNTFHTMKQTDIVFRVLYFYSS